MFYGAQKLLLIAPSASGTRPVHFHVVYTQSAAHKKSAAAAERVFVNKSVNKLE
jgi:hypothetical protein